MRCLRALRPQSAFAWSLLLCDDAAAMAAIAEFRRLKPDYTVASFRAEGLCANALCERQRERYYAGLAKAGLPP